MFYARFGNLTHQTEFLSQVELILIVS